MSEQTVEDIIDDLSYSWSSPEATHFHQLIKTKEIKDAQSMLEKEKLSSNQVKMVMDYFDQQYHQEKQLVEILLPNYDKIDNGTSIVVSYGGAIFQSQVIHNTNLTLGRTGQCFYDKYGSYTAIDHAVQIWAIVKK
jgi:hypothetical protein